MSLSNHSNHDRLSPPTSLGRSSSACSYGHKRSRSLGWNLGGKNGSFNGSSGTTRSISMFSPTGVLGQNSAGASPAGSRKSSQSSILGFNYSSKSKMSKTPQPVQAVTMFEAVGRGLRECINVAEQDIFNLRSNIESLSISSAQQLKAAERYLKRVEFQNLKLEELFDQYDLQQKLRDGVRSMAYAYVLSPGKERSSALNSVRSGYRECSEVMCSIESELEQMMGTLTMQMKGIQGYSRIMPGDVFEINIKHGQQKWKSRGRVMKFNHQSWDNDHVTFKVHLNDVLAIKALEIKGIKKNSILGNKYCDTVDLFSAHPQMMTVNLNSSGSLKLNLIVTWNPLHCACEENIPMLLSSNSNRSSPRSTRTFEGHSPISPSDSEASLPRYNSLNSKKFSIQREEPDGAVRRRPSPNELEKSKHEFSKDQTRSVSPISCSSIDTSSSLRGSGSQLDIVTIPVIGAIGLQETLNTIISCLEDIQGQYPELQKLESMILELDDVLRNRSRGNRRISVTSAVSLSVENALGCFDFLDSEEDSEIAPSQRLSPDDLNLEKVHVDKNTDQGFASITSQKSIGRKFSQVSERRASAAHFEQVELTLVTHLSYCQKLIESLGSFGPLKMQESVSLEKLKAQSTIIEHLLELVKLVKHEHKVICGKSEINDSELKALWVNCTENGKALCTTADMMSWKLQVIVDGVLPRDRQSLSSEVVRLLVMRMMDAKEFRSESIVTVYQFQNFLTKRSSVSQIILSLADEVFILSKLETDDIKDLETTVSRLDRNYLPAKEILIKLTLHLASDPEKKEFIAYYLEELSQNDMFQNEISKSLVENLEFDDEEIRRAACIALKYFQPYDFMDQLGYIAQTDTVNAVRLSARATLLTLGDFGQEALHKDYVGEPDYNPSVITSL